VQTQPQHDKAPSKEDVVRITSNLVQIDVTVTDKKGQPVPDLKDGDFEIYEDGRPQQITNLSFVSLGAATRTSLATNSSPTTNRTGAKTASEDVAPAPPERLRPEDVRRTIALVVDDLGLSFESVHFVRQALRNFVDEQMQPGDLAAIIRTGAGVGALQQFTSDKRLLYAAIERVKWNSRGRGGVAAFAPIEDSPLDDLRKRPSADGEPAPQSEATKGDLERNARAAYNDFKESIYSVGTLGALNYVVRGLRELPGRKSVVLMSDSIALFDLNDSNNFRTVHDISLFKNFRVGESKAFQIRADMFNAFNHAQYVPGSVNTVDPVATTGLTTLNQVNPLTADFLRPDRVLSSNPRIIQLAARFNF
jgi:VWFA-related protein